MLKRAHSIITQAASAIFPANCRVCGRGISGHILCHACSLPAPVISLENRCPKCFLPLPGSGSQCCNMCSMVPLPFRYVRCLYHYEGRVRRLVSTAKYAPSRRLVNMLGDLLAENIFQLFRWPDWHTICPLPSSPETLRQRGFNQCEIIARKIFEALRGSKMLHPELNLFSLTYNGKRPAQASVSDKERFRNIKGAFRCNGPLFSGRRVLLVDDVFTTGASSAAALAALLKAGAKSVDLVTVARAPSWYRHRDALSRFLDSNMRP